MRATSRTCSALTWLEIFKSCVISVWGLRSVAKAHMLKCVSLFLYLCRLFFAKATREAFADKDKQARSVPF